MTEQDAAMVDYRAATLATRYVALWISAAALAVSAAVGGAQCIVVWRGLRMIDRSNRAYAEAIENRRRESDRRHAKAMAAIADRRRATDAMIEKQRAAREDQQRATDAMIEGQRALIERTAPREPEGR